MIEVIGIKFSLSNKLVFFKTNEQYKKGNLVVCELERGEVLGKVVTSTISIDEKRISLSEGKIIRIANEKDIKLYEENKKLEEEACLKAKNIITDLGLNMRILNGSMTLNKTQLLFQFVSEERVDFRELAKKLAYIYKTRIELRQIGVRDKAREVSGYGQCGMKLCCSSFLDNLNSVSINMAKNQSLALNPQKINGACGRLLCCLGYENDLYTIYKKDYPNINDIVKTEFGKGKVIEVDLISRTYKVELEDSKVVEIQK